MSFLPLVVAVERIVVLFGVSGGKAVRDLWRRCRCLLRAMYLLRRLISISEGDFLDRTVLSRKEVVLMNEWR